jgi:hypothetical protein
MILLSMCIMAQKLVPQPEGFLRLIHSAQIDIINRLLIRSTEIIKPTTVYLIF